MFFIIIGAFFFFFNDTATTEIYTLSLHDALPISGGRGGNREAGDRGRGAPPRRHAGDPGQRRRRTACSPRPDDLAGGDRKSTRLNSSHANISYAVFCLKKNNPSNTLANPHRIHCA